MNLSECEQEFQDDNDQKEFHLDFNNQIWEVTFTSEGGFTEFELYKKENGLAIFHTEDETPKIIIEADGWEFH
jgi:hypothetical protein